MTLPKKKVNAPGLFDGEGNAFLILAKAHKAARKAKWSDDQWKEFADEAKNGDFDHLIQTTMKHFDDGEEE